LSGFILRFLRNYRFRFVIVAAWVIRSTHYYFDLLKQMTPR